MEIMTINPDETLFYILWAAAGCLMGVLVIYSQKKTVSLIGGVIDKSHLPRFFLYSIIRIILIVGILFIALRQSLWMGLTCLGFFLATRWISLLIEIRKNNSTRPDWKPLRR